jgi:hypothetical protein
MMRTRHWLAFVVFGTLFLPLLGAGDMKSQDLANDAPVVRAKIYDLTDLVVPTRVKPGELVPISMVEWLGGVRPDAEQGLGRIAKLVRLALPKEAWDENAGPGAIEIYAERFSLVIRQTEAGHRAVEALLQEIRQIDDVEIELKVEFVRLKEGAEKRCREENLGSALTPEQLQELGNDDQHHVMVFRTENGRTVYGPPGGYRLTPVASADRSTVDVRLDIMTPDGGSEFLWTTQSHRIPVGQTRAAIHMSLGDVLLVVTPRIIPRSGS